jgi:hypothetical protein
MKISFENNMNNLKKQLLVLPRTTVRGHESAALLRGGECCFYKLF